MSKLIHSNEIVSISDNSKPTINKVATKILTKNNIFRYIQKRSEVIHEILFYGAEDTKTRQQVGLNNLCCIYYVILHASNTIDVCVPSLVSDTIAHCLVTAAQKNKVKIRVAIHRSHNFCNLQSFAEHGIEVKVIRSERLEHEFILVDAVQHKDSVAVTGALDYQISRVNCNMDNTMVTSETVLVTSLKKEFDRIWESVPQIMLNKNANNLKTVGNNNAK